MMPQQKPHRSKQDYETPADLLSAIVSRFGPITWDLAATKDNAKAANYFSLEEGTNSLDRDWNDLIGVLFLNPPYSNIKPWVMKANEFRVSSYPSRLVMLLPASVGANWFYSHVNLQAQIIFLNGRVYFTDTPYPKDCMLCVYGHDISIGYEVWKWKHRLI